MSKLGPRACTLCPEGLRLPCWRCGARDRHVHVDVYGRDGTPLGSAASCEAHAPPRGVSPPIGPQVPAPAVTSLAKRARDRAYRLATSIVRSRHEDEFRQVYAQVLAGEVEGRDAA